MRLTHLPQRLLGSPRKKRFFRRDDLLVVILREGVHDAIKCILKGRRMNDRYDAYAAATIVTFGAIVIGGLMAAALSFGERDAFFFALGAGTSAWGAGYAMFLDKARVFVGLTALAVAMSIAAAILLGF